MATIETFTLTKNHLKLLKRMWVDWQDAETGAPAIDPKRPYGNSNVPADIHEILTGESIGRTDSKRDDLTDDEEETYLNLHKETETALQVVLATGKFKAGRYVADQYERNWRLAGK
jgi:hypothetical protein